MTAFQTATVRTRVDGQIMKVYFTEGQMIKEGEPLVEIDAAARTRCSWRNTKASWPATRRP